MLTYLYVHPWVLRYVLLGLGLFLVAELYYLFVVRPWRQSRRYALAYSAHRKPAARKDPVWDEAETAELDRAFARELAAARQEQLTPLPRDDIRSAWWDQPGWQRPETVSLPPWDSAPFAAVTEDLPVPADRSYSRKAPGLVMRGDGKLDLPGVPSDPEMDPPRRSPGDGKHARQSNLPGPVIEGPSQDRRAGEPDLLQPESTKVEEKTGRVLAPASILPVPPWPVTVVNVTIVRQEIRTHVPDSGDYDYDALQFISNLKAQCAAHRRSIRAWSAEIEDTWQRELTGATS